MSKLKMSVALGLFFLLGIGAHRVTLSLAKSVESSTEDVDTGSDDAETSDHDFHERTRARPEALQTTALLNHPEEDGLAERRGFVARPVEEWQGMLVRLEDMPTCDEHCMSPFACIKGRCAPCTRDNDCENGEACVLDHCIPFEAAECRKKADCDVDEFCVLSPYPEPHPEDDIDPLDVRGNEGMSSSCQRLTGGADFESPEGHDNLPDPPPEVDPLREFMESVSAESEVEQ